MGSTAESLAARIDALADALRAAGIDQSRMASILGSAAEATMHALVLDAVLDEHLDVAAAQAAVEQLHPGPDEAPVRLAA